MDASAVRSRLQHHLQVLVEDIGPRPAGSPANRRATDHVLTALAAAGWHVGTHAFRTTWWEPAPSRLGLEDGTWLELLANPFSAPGEVAGPVVWFDDRDALLAHRPDATGEVLVLGPAIGGEPVLPATFPFLEVPEQRELVAALERCHPAAVIAVSARHASLPTFEDPTLHFPSVTVGPELAARLVPGGRVVLEVGGRVHDGAGATVTGRTPRTGPRLVLSAHVDAKVTTPGAFDNGASVAALLTLAELAHGDLGAVELVFFNGEDHHDNAGEQAWLATTDLDEVTADLNLDGVGVAGRRTGVACLACPGDLEQDVASWVGRRPGWVVMAPWIESDHAIFAMRGIPAVAVTCEGVHDLLADVAHTPADTLDLLDLNVLVDVVDGLHDLVPRLSRR